MDKILKQSLGFDVSQEKFDVALFVCGEDLAPREVASETFYMQWKRNSVHVKRILCAWSN